MYIFKVASLVFAVAILGFIAFVMVWSKFQEKFPNFTFDNIEIKFRYRKHPHRYLYKSFYSKGTNGYFVMRYFDAFLHDIFSNNENALAVNYQTVVKNATAFLLKLCSDKTVEKNKRKSVVSYILSCFKLANITGDLSKYNLVFNKFKIIELKIECSLWKYSVIDLTNGIEKSFYSQDDCIKALFSEERFEIEKLPAKVIIETIQTAD